MKKIVPIVIFIMFFNIWSFAHSGRTDSNGGHYDTSSEEYHYHHGYSEHQHINGVCPYEAELSEILPATCPKCNVSVNSKNGIYCFDCAYRLVPTSLNVLSAVDGPADKTRSEYYNEVQTLKDKIEKLETQIQDSNNSIKKKDEEIKNKKSENRNIIIVFIIILGITIYVSYNMRSDKNAKPKNK